MSDLIRRADAIRAVAEHLSFDDGCSNIYKDIDYYKRIAEHILKNVHSALPSAEPVTSGYIADDKDAPPYETTTAVSEPVHGEWVQISPARIYECSKCGQNVMTDDIEAYKFCHGCGAKMLTKESPENLSLKADGEDVSKGGE